MDGPGSGENSLAPDAVNLRGVQGLSPALTAIRVDFLGNVEIGRELTGGSTGVVTGQDPTFRHSNLLYEATGFEGGILRGA